MVADSVTSKHNMEKYYLCISNKNMYLQQSTQCFSLSVLTFESSLFLWDWIITSSSSTQVTRVTQASPIPTIKWAYPFASTLRWSPTSTDFKCYLHNFRVFCSFIYSELGNTEESSTISFISLLGKTKLTGQFGQPLHIFLNNFSTFS